MLSIRNKFQNEYQLRTLKNRLSCEITVGVEEDDDGKKKFLGTELPIYVFSNKGDANTAILLVTDILDCVDEVAEPVENYDPHADEDADNEENPEPDITSMIFADVTIAVADAINATTNYDHADNVRKAAIRAIKEVFDRYQHSDANGAVHA